MPLVAMPDGANVSFPDDMPNEQIKGLIASKFPEAVPQQSSETKGFFRRVGSDWDKRTQQWGDIGQNGESLPERRLQYIGNIAGAVSDVATNAVGSLARTGRDLVTDPLATIGLPTESGQREQQAYGDAARDLYKDSLAQDAAQYVGGQVGQFQQNHPRAAANIGAGVNIAGLIPVGKAGQITAEAAGRAGMNELERLAVPKMVAAGADDVKDMGSKLYKAASEQGGILNPNFTGKFLSDLQAAKPKPIAGKVLTKEDRAFSDSLDEFKDLAGQPLHLDDVHRLDMALGDKIDSAMDGYRVTPAARKFIEIQQKFRESVATAKESDVIGGKVGFDSLSKARQLYAKQFKLRDIERIMDRAEMTDNPVASIKAGFRNLAMNAKKFNSYTPQERMLIKKAATTGIGTDILRVAGSRLNAIIAGSTGGIGAGAAAYGTSLASRSGANAMQAARAGRVTKAIVGDLKVPGEPTRINNAAQLVLNNLRGGQ